MTASFVNPDELASLIPPTLKATLPDLTPLLEPRSIAIVGASANPASIGGRPLANLRRFGFSGEIHLVSRSSSEIDGIRCVKSVSELPLGIDVALFVIPQSSAEEVLEECILRQVRSIVLFSAGFAEAGEEGAKLQARFSVRARAAGILLSGPNSLGIINHRRATPLTFGWIEPVPIQDTPAVAIVSQSGAIGMALTYATQSRGIPLAITISSGNEAALTLNDYLRHLLHDSAVSVVALFAEQIRNPVEFMALCDEAVALGKPLVLLKLGRSERAKAAAQSHTGALVGDHAAIAASLNARGVILVDTMDELLDVAGLLVRTPVVDPMATAAGIAVMSDSGALLSVALDSAAPLGIDFPPLSADTLVRLREELPAFAQAANPVDMTTQSMNDPGLVSRVAELLLNDPNYGSLAIFAMPGTAEHAIARANAVMPTLRAAGKPVAYTILGGDSGIAAGKLLEQSGFSAFRSPDAALKALSHVNRYAKWLSSQKSGAPIRAARVELPLEPGVLTEYRTKTLLRARGFPVPEGQLVIEASGLRAAATKFGYPLALKLQSVELMHKTEAGGVALNLVDADSLEAAYATMLKRVAASRPGVVLEGVLVEKMSAPGVEIALGVKNDPDWGPMLMVALGGVLIEVLHDVMLIPTPVSHAAAYRALRNLRAYPVLQGVRGAVPADIDALVELIVQVGELMDAHPEIAEMDLNPVFVHPKGRGVTVVDASIVAGTR